MASIINALPRRAAAASCLPGGVRIIGTAAPRVVAANAAAVNAVAAVRPAAREEAREAAASARPVAFSAVAAARIDAETAFAAPGAGTSQTLGQQKTQLHAMWALRGLQPWSDPA
ncbi:hypothetical protein [Streptomyces sp. 7-21]|jgi:hypothetical protein|uniref:hypothetical protein n=1 Tax=Streptomyces sp. 7-21 TaxID=2802283 RepID=UPI00191E689C|nr:hypothetical protein [Streptomyces sp. 7-21]MBL1066324.1 hypothetical protein [Streptomyces sp. 7-21]